MMTAYNTAATGTVPQLTSVEEDAAQERPKEAVDDGL
jgi:hypothetical protein